MLEMLTPLKVRWSLLFVTAALAALVAFTSPALADGGSNQSCSQRGGNDNDVLCVVNVGDVNVEINVDRVLNDIELNVIRDITVKDIEICKATGKDNNACSVVILDDVSAKVLTFVNVVVKNIKVTVGDITVQKIWIL